MPGGSLIVNSYVQYSPGIAGGCVMYGTPSSLLGTVSPWKCSTNGSVIWFCTTKRTRSPSLTLISGPGT